MPRAGENPDAAAAAAKKKEEKMAGGGVIFNPYIVVRDSVVASHRTSTGIPISVSLSLATPPAISLIHLHCAEAAAETLLRRHRLSLSSLFAADAHLLLLRVIIPIKRAYPEEGVIIDEEIEERSSTIVEDLEEGSITMKEVAKLSVLQCSADRDLDNSWVVKKLAMPFDSDGDFGPNQWKSEIAFGYDDTMYWVDYNIGLIFCDDVFESSPKLQLIKFPLPVRKTRFGEHDPNDNRGQLESFRTVGVSNGKIKFVDVDNCHSHIIRTWTLKMPEMVWELEDMLDVNDLWASESFKKYGLHQWVPEYPVVSLLDPDIVHFVLREPIYHEKVWMITVDMKAKSVGSCKNYSNGEKGDESEELVYTSGFICKHHPLMFGNVVYVLAEFCDLYSLYHEKVWTITVDMRAKSVESCKNYSNGEKGDESEELLYNSGFIHLQ
uniref:DUF1618 domain-containing protein n=1 Tax=Leersia perrieri TaxID=77586 RepID=A0A0D9XXG2_9ORYZ